MKFAGAFLLFVGIMLLVLDSFAVKFGPAALEPLGIAFGLASFLPFWEARSKA